MTPEKSLNNWLAAQNGHHTHVDAPLVRALFVAAEDITSDVSVRVQKVVAACRVCSALLAESRPTYAAGGSIVGARSV